MSNELAQVQARLRASELAQVAAKTADAPRAHPPFRAGLPKKACAALGFTFGGAQAALARTAPAPPPPEPPPPSVFTFGRAPAPSADPADAAGAIEWGELGN